ncbi:flagellar protein FliO/FliZ [Limimonas halophila]|uniref:Flagellar protein FliO/FliZ n=1 Tax=Limimonas halophila TaxID=1082479 RepID=A0A1G7Q6N8_9PROT|nr:hypothetical protein [Limimonas halophila]SDF94118.1 flagellar protein FliO/FliZ [Limimonas halophila]
MNYVDYTWFVLALVLVIGLILLAGKLAQWFGVGGAKPTRLGRKRRLTVSEVLPIDSRTKAVLLRRDDVEHLVLLGSQDTRVVERGIGPAASSFQEAMNEDAGE